MGCFCHRTLGPLLAGLPALDVGLAIQLPQAHIVLSLADWLGTRGLPAAPWQPDPDWLRRMLPSLRLNASAAATISALAQLRAQVLAQFGIDLLLPAGPPAFARIVATMNVRLSAMASASFNPGAWISLAALNAAIDRITLALQTGALSVTAGSSAGSVPMADWRAFLAALARLVPLIAAGLQLNLNLAESFSAQLAAALRVLRAISLPAIGGGNLAFMASLTGALSAVAQLRASLGIEPLVLGLPAVRALVSARLTAQLSALAGSLRLNLQSPNLLAELLALLPNLPYCPTTLANTETVRAAFSLHVQTVESLAWQVPPFASLPVLRIGLPACALAAQLQAGLGISAVLAAPCGATCDAASTMRALAQATA